MVTELTVEQLVERFEDQVLVDESQKIQQEFDDFMAEIERLCPSLPGLDPEIQAAMNTMDPPLTDDEIREFVDGIELDLIPAVTDEEIEELFKEQP